MTSHNALPLVNSNQGSLDQYITQSETQRNSKIKQLELHLYNQHPRKYMIYVYPGQNLFYFRDKFYEQGQLYQSAKCLN